MLWTLITWVVLGLIAGAVARLLVPGPDPMSIPATILLGVVGSFVGYLLFDKDFGEGALQPSGIVGSILGAIVVLLVWRTVGGRRHALRR